MNVVLALAVAAFPHNPNRGAWVVGALYYVNDIVEHEDFSFTCLVQHVSTADREPGHAPRTWSIIV